MAMGKNGTINMTIEMFQALQTAINNYRTTTEGLKTNVDTEMQTVAQNFTGSAGTAFQNYYTQFIQPFIGEKLTNFLLDFESRCKCGGDNIPGTDGVDEVMANANKDIGSESQGQ